MDDPRTRDGNECQENCGEHVSYRTPDGRTRHNPASMTDTADRIRAFGVHLMPVTTAVDTPRPSVVVEIDASGAIAGMAEVRTLDEIAAEVGPAPALLVVDAPLRAPDRGGRRTVDELLGWLDTPVLPISRPRLESLYGGVRGEQLAAHPGLRGQTLAESFPDLVLRLLAWERRRPAETVDLAAFRAEWLGLRPVPYRPKGVGRAKPAGLLPAFDLLADAVDFGGWTPGREGDFGAIQDAAVLDAAACAHVAWRAVDGADGDVVHLTADGATVILPCDANLAERIEVNRERLGVPRIDGATGVTSPRRTGE